MKHLEELDRLATVTTRKTQVTQGLRKKVKPPVALADLKPPDPVHLIQRLEGTSQVDEKAEGNPIVAVTLQSDKLKDLDLAELRALKDLQCCAWGAPR